MCTMFERSSPLLLCVSLAGMATTTPANGFTSDAVASSPALDKRPSFPARVSTLNRSNGASSSATGPLHLKVSRLLSANLDDHGTRTALDTLGEFEPVGAATLSSSASNTAPNTILGIGGALRRGGLRKEVECRMAEGSKEFLQAFSEVNEVRGIERVELKVGVKARLLIIIRDCACRNWACYNLTSTQCTFAAIRSRLN